MTETLVQGNFIDTDIKGMTKTVFVGASLIPEPILNLDRILCGGLEETADTYF